VSALRVGIIAPTPHLFLCDYGHYYFILAQHVLRDKEYGEFFAKATLWYKMLDNGCWRLKRSIPAEQLLAVANYVGAHVIVVPDALGKYRETKQLTQGFLDILTKDERKRYKLCVVPQGKDVQEFIRCYIEFSQLDVHMIGLPKFFMYKRPAIVHYLIEKRLFDWRKEHHLFGLTSVFELFSYPMQDMSVDTSLPVTLALQGEGLSPFSYRKRNVRLDLSQQVDNLALAVHNVKELVNICRSLG